MKKALLVFTVLGLFFTTVAATCEDDDKTVVPTTPQNEEKEYTCKCTYVPVSGTSAEGQPNKEETATIVNTSLQAAKIECSGLDSKYFSQYFSGTCLIQ